MGQEELEAVAREMAEGADAPTHSGRALIYTAFNSLVG
jgi:hypothetical protein